MRNNLSKILNECIEQINNGETIESCLARHAEVQDELKPLLEIALAVSNSPKVLLSEDYKETSKAKLIERIKREAVHTAIEESVQEKSLLNGISAWWSNLWQSYTPVRRATITVTVILLLALVANFLPFDSLKMLPTASTAITECNLGILSGSVQIREDESANWRNAINGMTLKVGTQIQTGVDSNALINFSEKSSIRLNPNTLIEIKQLEINDDDTILLGQLTGSTWSHVSQKSEPDSHFQIETPSATAKVLGTLFMTEVDEKGFTRVATTEGMVGVIAQGKEVQIPANQETTVTTGAAPSQPVTTPEPKNEVIVTVFAPAYGSITDPAGSSTGYLPDGSLYNHINGSVSSLNANYTQVIKLSDPETGNYNIALRYSEPGSALVKIQGIHEGNTVFENKYTLAVINESKWLIQINLQIEDGSIISAELDDVEPLKNNAPENTVLTGDDKDKTPPFEKADKSEKGKKKEETLEDGSEDKDKDKGKDVENQGQDKDKGKDVENQGQDKDKGKDVENQGQDKDKGKDVENQGQDKDKDSKPDRKEKPDKEQETE
ncbi:FecR domain-containing protein [Chloroflexota bacterium]